jgi:hypothetical protein
MFDLDSLQPLAMAFARRSRIRVLLQEKERS